MPQIGRQREGNITIDRDSPKRWVALALLVVVALGSGCHQLQPRPDLPHETVLQVAADSELDGMFGPEEAKHPGQSGFRLLREGPEAFVTRLGSARRAGRSLDVQTYIWHADTTGLYLVREVLRAADRGVQVRLLVDDIDAREKNLGFAALAAHPNIAVRLFNPFASRKGHAAFASEGLRNFRRINRRMHNKSWIADNRFAVAGGRNLGDEYFGASDEVNFVDLDFAMVGPIVREASASFDRYWNSAAAYPMEILDAGGVTPEALATLRATLDERIDEARVEAYRRVLGDSDAVRRLGSGEWPLHWTARARFVADDPAKISRPDHDEQRSTVLLAVLPMLRDAQTDLGVISPYFVPRERGVARLVATVEAGARVRVLTNSLAATDVAAVHGGYARSRPALLEGGVELWELKPGPAPARTTWTGSSGASLHTKALVADSRVVFVGSYNLDPRSTWLNCEQGVLVEHPALAREVEAILAELSSGARAWKVVDGEDGLRWSDGARSFRSEPEASAGKQFRARMARLLHLDAQL